MFEANVKQMTRWKKNSSHIITSEMGVGGGVNLECRTSVCDLNENVLEVG